MAAVTHTLDDVFDRLTAQSVANILWATAKLGRAVLLLDRLPLMAAAAEETIPEMQAQQVANSIWAISKLYGQEGELLELLPLLVRRAIKALPDMDEQGIANIIYASHALGHASHELRAAEPLLTNALPNQLSTSCRQQQSSGDIHQRW